MTFFMIEIRVSDWDGAVAWYAGTLGLQISLRDEPNRFVLLEAPGGGRIALKEGRPGPIETDRVRLIFQVDDLDAERSRLQERGVAVGAPVENVKERYREVRLNDPEGRPILLFAWSQ